MFGKKPSQLPRGRILDRKVQAKQNAMPASSKRPENLNLPRRIIPAELFEGETGKFLTNLGLSADDPSNLIPSAAEVDLRDTQLKFDEKKFVGKINSQLPSSATVKPFPLIPHDCWSRGAHRDFLAKHLGLHRYGPWNLVLLPENDGGSFVLNMIKCPSQHKAGLFQLCEAEIQRIRQSVTDTQAQGNKILQLAHSIGIDVMGEEGFSKCQKMFFGGK